MPGAQQIFAPYYNMSASINEPQLLAHFRDLSVCDFNVFVCHKLFSLHKCKSQLYKSMQGGC